MKSILLRISILSTICILFLQTVSFAQTPSKETLSWDEQFNLALPLLGHRNWVLIVDAAYPLQSSPAIETIIADAKIESVTKTVLNSIDKAPHVKPIIYQDKEFSYMRNEWSRGCERLYGNMQRLLAPYDPKVIPHDDIFAKLDSASKLFNVVVIKTNCMIPYSSVFIEIDCGYWDSNSEEALRKSMK